MLVWVSKGFRRYLVPSPMVRLIANLSSCEILKDAKIATTLFSGLVQQGLPYPMFGLSLTREGGSLSLGAIDASIVTTPRNLSWNNVAEFSPFGSESNTSSYLHWAIPLTSFSANGTQLTPIPSQAAATRNVSLALLDVYVFFFWFDAVCSLLTSISEAHLACMAHSKMSVFRLNYVGVHLTDIRAGFASL